MFFLADIQLLNFWGMANLVGKIKFGGGAFIVLRMSILGLLAAVSNKNNHLSNEQILVV